MARHRWTLALIIVCLPILVTVITAFRVHKGSYESAELGLKKQKCDDCDVNDEKFGKSHSVKIENAKRSYEELKKAVREKQQLINQKKVEPKVSFKYENDDEDDDDDDDEDINLWMSKSSLKVKDRVRDTKDSKGSKESKSLAKSKQSAFADSNDDDDDDDDNDDYDDNFQNAGILETKNKINTKKDKISKETKSKLKTKSKAIANDVDNDDDDDDDDDDDNFLQNARNMEPKNKIDIKEISKENKSKLKAKSRTEANDLDDDDDDDDDDGDDDDDLNRKRSQTVSSKKDKIVKKYSVDNKERLQEDVVKDKVDMDDDDDDDDSDDEGDGALTKRQLKTSTKTDDVVKEVPKHNEAGKELKDQLQKDVQDDDDIDDEDNDDDDDKVSKSSISKKTPEKDNPKQHSKAQPKKTSIKFTLDDDTDDDDDDDDDDEEDDKKVKLKSKLAEKNQKLESPEVKLKGIEQQKSSETIPKPTPSSAKKEDKKEYEKPKFIDEKPKKEILKEEPSKKHKDVEKDAVKTKPQEKKEKVADLKKSEKKSVSEIKVKHDKSKKDDDLGHKKHEKRDRDSTEMLSDSQETLAKSESNLKQVTDALNRRNLLQSEFEDFYAYLPTFAPNFSRIHNPECRRHGQIVLRQLRGTKLWALNMLDATAKIPSGILQGNGIQLGDFDQCLGSRARVQLDTGTVVKVQGKYCLARLDLKAEHPELEVPVHLAQAKNLFKSRIDDPGHFVPRFSTLSWGVCVPAACNPEDVEVVLKDALKHYQHTSGVVIRVKVDEDDCHTYEGNWWDDWLELPIVLTMSFYAVIILLVLVATIQDFIAGRKSDEGQGGEENDDKAECDQKETDDEEKEEINDKKSSDGFLSSFSLYRTISKLVAPAATDEISCINGVRGVATIALLIAHKSLPVAVTPYTNRLKVTEVVSSPLWSWTRAGWMYSDCFLLLSGTLTAHRISSDSETGAPWRLFLRYIRLTPALLAVVLFYAYVWDNISTGPMWGTLVTKNAEVCQQGWWWNLLYVQNYFGFEDMCAPQTHQLALDMQLTIIGYLVVWVIQLKPIVKWLLPAVHMWSAFSRYNTVQEHRLTMLAYHGVSVSQLYRTARLSYTSIFHRSTPYLVGLSLGLALQKPSKHNKFVQLLGWITGITLWSLVWWAGMDSGSTMYRYNAVFAAQYAALAPIASSLAIAWLIYAVHTGHCEFLFNFLCCRPLVLISRVSYALYLCQFIVFLTNAAMVKTSREFTIMSLIDLAEISIIILSSTIITLTFVIPMQTLNKAFTFSSKTDTEEVKESENIETHEKDIESETKTEPEEIEVPQIRSRQYLVAHREVLEEIPEAEVEFEIQRQKNDGLEEILEEEEDEIGDESLENHMEDEELEIIEEEQGGEDDFWVEGEENDYTLRRSYQVDDDQEIDEWEWTTNGSNRNGAQHYRHRR